MFEQSGEDGKDDPLKMVVAVPAEFEDNLGDIAAAIRVTLAEWPGCKVN